MELCHAVGMVKSKKQNMLESSSSPSVYIDPICHCNNNHMEKMQREFLTLMLDKR